jgi:hypothetical protein
MRAERAAQAISTIPKIVPLTRGLGQGSIIELEGVTFTDMIYLVRCVPSGS